MRWHWYLGFVAAGLVTIGRPAWAQEDVSDSIQSPVPQRDLLDLVNQILHRKPDSAVVDTPKVVVSLLPAFSVNPVFGVSLGVSANALTRFGPEQTTNRSNASASVTYTTKRQFNILVRSNIFGAGNRFLLQGDWRYLDTSQPTYGLGPVQPESRKDVLEFQLIRIYQTVYRPLSNRFLAGLGYHLNAYFNIVDPNAEQGLPSPFLDYNQGRTVTHHTSSGLSVNLAFDSRDNPINATQGYYATVSLRAFPTWLGSDTNWQSFQTDFRTYRPLGSAGRNVLAVWATTWFTFGTPPYLELPAVGWDTYARSGRAYPQGRIRGENQLYLEGEYRVTLSRDGFWGAAAFLNLLSTSDPETGSFEPPNLGVGVGLRVKLDKRSAVNITIDYAVGAAGSNGLFLGSSEAF